MSMTAEQTEKLKTYDGIKQLLVDMYRNEPLVHQVFDLGEQMQLERGHIYALLAFHAVTMLREARERELDYFNRSPSPLHPPFEISLKAQERR